MHTCTLGVTGLKTRLSDRVFKGMDVSRKTLMSRVQASSGEIVCWIDCVFYLMPMTSSKLYQYGLSWNDIKVVNPLNSECTKNDPVFEYTDIPKFEEENEENEEICTRKHQNFLCNLSFSVFSHSNFHRIFFSPFI